MIFVANWDDLVGWMSVVLMGTSEDEDLIYLMMSTHEYATKLFEVSKGFELPLPLNVSHLFFFGHGNYDEPL